MFAKKLIKEVQTTVRIQKAILSAVDKVLSSKHLEDVIDDIEGKVGEVLNSESFKQLVSFVELTIEETEETVENLANNSEENKGETSH